MGYCDGAALPDLFPKPLDHGTRGIEHVPETDYAEAGAVAGTRRISLDNKLCDALARPHDALRANRLVSRDHRKACEPSIGRSTGEDQRANHIVCNADKLVALEEWH